MIPGVPIDVELVRRLIAAQFPQWSDLPVRAVEPGGWDNRTFRLGDRLSVRLPSALAYVAQVEKEQEWLPKLAPHLPLPIPVPMAKGAPTEAYPWPWSVYQWLDGEPATARSISDMTGFAKLLARFLDALHRINAEGAPPPGEHNFHRGGCLALYDGETRATLLALAGRLDTAVVGEIWSSALSSRWRGPPLWLHGDMASGNLLMKAVRFAPSSILAAWPSVILPAILW